MFNKGKKHIFDFKEVKAPDIEADEKNHEEIELDDLSVSVDSEDIKEEIKKEELEVSEKVEDNTIEEVKNEETIDKDFDTITSISENEDINEVKNNEEEVFEIKKENKFKEALVSLSGKLKNSFSKASSELNKR